MPPKWSDRLSGSDLVASCCLGGYKLTSKTKNILVIIAASFLILTSAVFIIGNRRTFWLIIKPFVIGIIIAYIFDPPVKALMNRGLGRMAAVLIVYFAIIGAAAALLSFLLPLVYREAMRLMDILPSYAIRAKEYLDGIYIRFSRSLTPELREAVRNNIDYIQQIIISQVNSLTDKLMGFFEGLVNWIIALVVSFYLLKDKDYFLSLLEYMIPVRLRQDTSRIGSEIDSVLMGFIRGELLVALVVGALASIGFLIIDLNFAILMGIITGVGNIIPYFGPILGGVPVAVVGLMESPAKAIWAIAVVVVIQQLESGIITPKIMGDSVGMHPVFIIMSLLVAAHFFGLVGMLLAVPVAAVIKVFVLYIFDKIVNTI